MSNYSTLLDVMKQTSVNANRAQKPVAVYFGKVTSTSPLNVAIDQRITLTEGHLVRTKTVEVLEVNEQVVLLRMQGGQRYIIIDKVVQ